MLREKEARSIVVAFRGADTKRVSGLLTDVALAPVPAVLGSSVTQARTLNPRLRGGDGSQRLRAQAAHVTLARVPATRARTLNSWVCSDDVEVEVRSLKL